MKKQTTKPSPAQGVKEIKKRVASASAERKHLPSVEHGKIPTSDNGEAEQSNEVTAAVETKMEADPAATESIIHFPKFEGDTEGLATMKVDPHIGSVGWNQHLPCPLMPDETVHVHPDQAGVQHGYVRIIHGSEKKLISTFSMLTLNGPPKATPEAYKPNVVASQAEQTIEPREVGGLTLPPKIGTSKKKELDKPKGITVFEKEHSKSGAVLAILKHYIESHKKTTLKQIKETFPDSLLKRFGIIQEISKAMEIANGGNRYFFKHEHQMALSDGTILVACNQITSENIKPFVEKSKSLGYDIVVHD